MEQKTITYTGAGIIAVLVLALILAIGSNAKNKKNLGKEKTNSESLLLEKQKLESNLEKLNSDLSRLNQQSDANARLLEESNLKIAENEKKNKALSGEVKMLRSDKMELADLKKAKADLDAEYSQLKSERDRILVQNKDLEKSIASLENEKSDLTAQIEKARLYNTDNFLVTATRGKKTEKIVIRASRTKKINMSFEIPQNLTETISFKIGTPGGAIINPEDKGLSWFFPLDSRKLTASLSAVTGEFEPSKQVVLNYVSKGKLAKGEYKIQIFSNGNNVGNCRIMLR